MDEPGNGGSAAGLSRGRRMLVLAICCLSLLIVGLDTTIVNVALPAIRSSLHASVSGIGAGLVNPPITNTAVSGMPPSQAGVAAAIASTSRQVGMTLGVAVLGAISGGMLSGALGPSFAAATHAGWWICAGLGAACLVLGVLTTTRWADQTARETAERFRESEPPSVSAPRGRQERRALAAQ